MRGSLFGSVQKTDDLINFSLASTDLWVVSIDLFLNYCLLSELSHEVVGDSDEMPGIVTEVVDGTLTGVKSLLLVERHLCCKFNGTEVEKSKE